MKSLVQSHALSLLEWDQMLKKKIIHVIMLFTRCTLDIVYWMLSSYVIYCYLSGA